MLSVLSEFFINIGAGFFAAVFITPTYSSKNKINRLIFLNFNLILMILSLVISYKLKQLS